MKPSRLRLKHNEVVASRVGSWPRGECIKASDMKRSPGIKFISKNKCKFSGQYE